ncbi:hypothetical protein AAFF_G00259510, partial [Aldrovandia affinis]
MYYYYYYYEGFKRKKVDEKQLKQKFDEEWSRREEELMERMGTVLLNSETEGSTLPVRKRRNSLDIDYCPPSMSGGTPAPSEAGSSVRGYESAHERSKQNVSWWLNRSKTERSVPSGYGTRSSVASEAESELEKDSGCLVLPCELRRRRQRDPLCQSGRGGTAWTLSTAPL